LAFASRFISDIGTPEGQTVSQSMQPVHMIIQSSTDASAGERKRCAPGPACFGPGNAGDTRETGQTVVQFAQRTQTSEKRVDRNAASCCFCKLFFI
jgi:hypothetical protein